MKIVSIDKIPKSEQIVDAPVDDLLALYKVCQKMADFCIKENGIGLSAAQVGIPWRLFVMKAPSGKFEFLVNCDYKPIGDKKAVSVEGCLSLRKNGELRRFRVDRWERINFTGFVLLEGEDGKPVLEEIDRTTLPNIYNVVYQHETDHQLGIEGLISNKGEEIYLRG